MAISEVISAAETPRYACCTLPASSSCATTLSTVLDGTAKPMPTFPSPEPPVSICELTPITAPRELRSGPPLFPWLIAASVWITWSIEYPFGACTLRCSALTIPEVTVRSRPNGLPIATTGSPTSTSFESASEKGIERVRVGIDIEEGEVGRGVTADERRRQRVVVREAHLDRRRVLDHVVVRDDMPLGVDHEAGSERLARRLRLVALGRRPADRRGDLDDSGAAPLVDLVDREPGAGSSRNRDRAARPTAERSSSTSCRRAHPWRPRRRGRPRHRARRRRGRGRRIGRSSPCAVPRGAECRARWESSSPCVCYTGAIVNHALLAVKGVLRADRGPL